MENQTDFSLDIDITRFPSFQDFLEASGRGGQVRMLAEKIIVARQIAHDMKQQKLSKSAMASRMGTSRAQLDRVLNPSANNVTLDTLARAASVLGRSLHIELR